MPPELRTFTKWETALRDMERRHLNYVLMIEQHRSDGREGNEASTVFITGYEVGDKMRAVLVSSGRDIDVRLFTMEDLFPNYRDLGLRTEDKGTGQ